MYWSIRNFKSSSSRQFLWLGHFHNLKWALCTKRSHGANSTFLVGKRARLARQTKTLRHSKTEANILSFQSPTASFAIQQGVFFFYHVTVSCKGPIELVKLSLLGKKYCSNTQPYFGYNTRSHAPTPGKKKKTVEKFNSIPRQTSNVKVTYNEINNLSLEFLHIFSPIFSSFIRRTQLSLQHQISIFTIICTEDSIISTNPLLWVLSC